MLQASKNYVKFVENTTTAKEIKEDIIVYRAKDTVIENEDGSFTTRREYEPVNLTRKISETAKMVKALTAEQKLAEMEKVLQK